METHSSYTYTSNGSSDGVNLEPESETYHKVHHDLDSAAANRKPIVTESNYKVKRAEPGVEDLHLGDHGSHESKASHESKTSRESKTVTKRQQFIAKPDVYSDDEDDAADEGGFPWLPVLGGAAAIAGVVAGLLFYKKRNPDADQRFRRTVEDADHRVKGAFGSGERRVKEFLGTGQQKLKNLVGRGDHGDSDDEGHSHSHDGHGHGHNPLNVFDHDGDLYKVKQGDNMTKIARKAGKKSWHEIAEENPSIRNPDLIYPGEKLRV